jgi:hypothetical protein
LEIDWIVNGRRVDGRQRDPERRTIGERQLGDVVGDRARIVLREASVQILQIGLDGTGHLRPLARPLKARGQTSVPLIHSPRPRSPDTGWQLVHVKLGSETRAVITPFGGDGGLGGVDAPVAAAVRTAKAK